MLKYAPLHQHLANSKSGVLSLTFSEIEKIIGAKLPPSAFKYREWWANDFIGRHTQAHAWGYAGYKVAHVDFANTYVVFRRG